MLDCMFRRRRFKIHSECVTPVLVLPTIVYVQPLEYVMIETEAMRRHAVEKENASNALEGIVRPPDVELMAERYIRGEIGLSEFAHLQRVAAYQSIGLSLP